MYTQKRYPGKFEGNQSQLVARVVYNNTLDGCCEDVGEADGFGYYARIEGKQHTFILSEDSQGFVYVTWYDKQEGAKKWGAILSAYETFCEELKEA